MNGPLKSFVSVMNSIFQLCISLIIFTETQVIKWHRMFFENKRILERAKKFKRITKIENSRAAINHKSYTIALCDAVYGKEWSNYTI